MEESTEKEQLLLQERTEELESAKKGKDRSEKAVEEYKSLIESLILKLSTTNKEKKEVMQQYDEQKARREKAIEKYKGLIESLIQQLSSTEKEKKEAMQMYDEELEQTVHELEHAKLTRKRPWKRTEFGLCVCKKT